MPPAPGADRGGDGDAAALIAALAEAPARITALFRAAGEAASAASPAPDEWSASDVLAHLRASDAILAPRLFQIAVRDDPALPAFDERRWAEVAGYAALSPAVLLEGYASRRAELVAMLCRLAPADWQRAGQHEVAGRVTLLDIARHLATHEAEHVAQLEAALHHR